MIVFTIYRIHDLITKHTFSYIVKKNKIYQVDSSNSLLSTWNQYNFEQVYLDFFIYTTLYKLLFIYIQTHIHL